MTTTITGLPNGTTPLDGTERVPMDQAGVTVDATTQDIADLAISPHVAAADPHPGYALESSLATVATSGAYSDLTGTPTLGGAAALDVGTTAGTVAAGDDGRLSTDLSYTASTRVLGSSTGADATLPLFTSTDAGLTPLSGGGTTNFLRADGTWAAPAGGGTPGGTTDQLQWNSAGSFAGVGGSTVGATGDITLSLNGAASTPPLKLSGTWFTGGTSTTTKPQVLIEPAGTTSTAWSTSGTGLGVNAPSGFAGNLLDLQVNGASKFNARSNGIFGTSTAWLAPSSTGVFRVGSATADGRGIIGLRTIVGSSGFYGFSDSNSITDEGDYDLAFFRDAADTLAQRRSTNAQTYRLYNTYTSATSFERAKLSWNTNVLEVGTEKGGDGGTARDMVLQTDGTTRITLKADGAILFSGLPTSDPAVAGQLWNDGNTLKISAG